MKIVFHITDKNSSVERITAPYTIATDEGSLKKKKKKEMFIGHKAAP